MTVNIKKKHKGYPLKHQRLRIGLSNDEANALITVLSCGNEWMRSQVRDVSFGEKFLNELTQAWVKIDPRPQH